MLRAFVLGLLVLVGAGATAGTVDAQSVDEPEPAAEDDTGVVTAPDPSRLIPVPVGCEAPTLPRIVFVGTVVDRDFRTIRYRIDTIRAGRSDPFALGDLIDVRYGLDTQYLDDDGTYLVSAMVDPDLGLLVSRTSEPIEDFGGDEVIGVSETDVNCPDEEDPMRTLNVDGTPVDGGVLDPLFESKVRIAGAFVLPLSVAIGVIFVLSMFRLTIARLYHTVIDEVRRRRLT